MHDKPLRPQDYLQRSGECSRGQSCFRSVSTRAMIPPVTERTCTLPGCWNKPNCHAEWSEASPDFSENKYGDRFLRSWWQK